MTGDTFDFAQGNRDTLRGTLHDPAATPGNVLTVQTDGSVAAAPGGGSMPNLAAVLAEGNDAEGIEITNPAPLYSVPVGPGVGQPPFQPGTFITQVGIYTIARVIDTVILNMDPLLAHRFHLHMTVTKIATAEFEELVATTDPIDPGGGFGRPAWAKSSVDQADLIDLTIPTAPHVTTDGAVYSLGIACSPLTAITPKGSYSLQLATQMGAMESNPYAGD